MDNIRDYLRDIRDRAHWIGVGTSLKTEINIVRVLIRDLTDIINKLVDRIEIQQSPEAAPFQPECKCEIVQNSDGILTIYHCQYHRSITYVYDELTAVYDIMEQGLATSGRLSIADLLSFLGECKKNSLTGEIGKPRDENVGR